MTPRPRRRERALHIGALGVAAVATVALTQVPVSGAFSGVSGNTANSVSSAASFCTAAATTLYSSGDTWTDEAAPSVNHQSNLELRVRSLSAGNRHIWTGFALPPVPAHCELTQAQLNYYNKTPTSGRNIDVYRGAALWTADAILWSNEPGYLGPAVVNAATPSVPGWQEWVVTDHVRAHYAGGNTGFLLRDRTENSGTSREQVYYDRQNSTYRPNLVLTWG